MSLSGAIDAARSGLQINGLRADIVANNVANAATPGYVRRSLVLSEQLVAGDSNGVRAEGIARSQDAVLTAQRRAAGSDLAQANVLSSAWQTISARLGDTAEGTGLFQHFADFERGLRNAVAAPESSADLNVTLSAAQSIIGEFHALTDMVANQRKEADRAISDGVLEVNAALKDIERLNGEIASAGEFTNRAAGLKDERQRALDTVAEYMPLQVIERDRGRVDVLTQEGVYLVAGTAKQLEFEVSTAFQAGQTVETGDLSRLTVEGVDLTPGATSYGAVSSGLFGALFTLRDQDLPGFQAQLDTLAGDLIGRLSADSIDPTKTPGDPGLFVDSAGTGDPGLAGRIALNPAVDPAQGGEAWRLRDGLEAAAPGPTGYADILQGLLDGVTTVNAIDESGIQGAFSSTELVGHFASLTGQKRVGYEAVLSSTTAQHAMLRDAEQAQTAVDTDAEMQDLLLIEQAYAANARVIQVANEMLNRLMEL